MTKELFEREILRLLEEHRERRPGLRQQDVVKFVFQAMLGVGHLLSSSEAAEAFIAREAETLRADPAEPLTERLSPAWCRLSLRGAWEMGFTPTVIAGLMFASSAALPFTREDVFRFCGQLAASGDPAFTDARVPEQILDETWLPSHSAAYRELYHPAYRVVSAEWIPRMEAVRRMAAARAERVLVTIDGPCASGKTTLAEDLAAVFGAAVAHTDDFVVPHARKTTERLAQPGGNCDRERLAREIAAPWKRGEAAVFRRYDCHGDRLLPAERLPESRILILEGSYCNLPEIRQYADVRIFLNTRPEVRRQRLEHRESEQSLRMFRDRWIPLENRYFEAFGLPDPECIVITEDGE